MRCDDRGARVATRPNRPVVFLAVAWVSVVWANPAPVAAAAPPPELRLPPDVTYQLIVGPDSAVVFSHQTHFALAGNRCTACHPQTFRILSPTKHIAHREMEAGRSCGSCHDGRQAFGVRDSAACSSCHSGRSPVAAAAGKGGAPAGGASRGPGPITYSKSDASPGPVTFRHAAHGEKKLACASCHPRPFAMKAAGRSGAALHEVAACGACHDGAKAFGVEDAEACGRCHAARGGTP